MAKTKASATSAPAIRKRGDGFYEVSGVAGYFRHEDAKRVAKQVGEAIEQNTWRPTGTMFDAGAGDTTDADDADAADDGNGANNNT